MGLFNWKLKARGNEETCQTTLDVNLHTLNWCLIQNIPAAYPSTQTRWPSSSSLTSSRRRSCPTAEPSVRAFLLPSVSEHKHGEHHRSIRLKRNTEVKIKICKDGSPCLVVMGDDSCSKGRGFESQCLVLDGHFSHWFVVKIVLFVWKDQK